MSHCCEQDEGVEQIWRHVLLLRRVEANTRQAFARAKTIRWGVQVRWRNGKDRRCYCRNNAGDSKLRMVVRAVAQSVSSPFRTEKTSAAATDRVRPDLRTRPRATSLSPTAGASSFSV